MRIIFLGTDDFAASHLKALYDFGHEIVACVTPPDKPKGRGMKVSVSAVKEFAEKNNISVLQPASLKADGIVDGLKQLNADLFVVIAYGKLLPQSVIDVPPFGVINVHGSLLPKYRGAAPINWAILNGEKETGLSIIQINPLMDAGDILSQSKVAITEDDTSISLREKLMKSGNKLLLDTVLDIFAGKAKKVVQDEKLVTIAPKLTKELGVIDWSKPAEVIHNQIRGLLPWPSAYTTYEGKVFKMLLSKVVSDKNKLGQPGEVIEINKNGMIVGAGQGALLIEYVHLADSKPMAVKDFLRGHQIVVGHIFKS